MSLALNLTPHKLQDSVGRLRTGVASDGGVNLLKPVGQSTLFPWIVEKTLQLTTEIFNSHGILQKLGNQKLARQKIGQ